MPNLEERSVRKCIIEPDVDIAKSSSTDQMLETTLRLFTAK